MGAVASCSGQVRLHDQACAMLHSNANLVRTGLQAKPLATCSQLQDDSQVELGKVSVVVLVANEVFLDEWL